LDDSTSTLPKNAKAQNPFPDNSKGFSIPQEIFVSYQADMYSSFFERGFSKKYN